MPLSETFKTLLVGAGKMVQWLRALTALAVDMGLVPGTPIQQLRVICNSSSRRSDASFDLHGCTYVMHRRIHRSVNINKYFYMAKGYVVVFHNRKDRTLFSCGIFDHTMNPEIVLIK